MEFIKTKIPDVIVIQPKIFQDSRGHFSQTYHKENFFENGIRVEFVQDNQSFSKKGVVRALHYQLAPKAQAKLVRVVRGEVFDVAVDIRKGSRTFGQYVSEILSAENKKMLYVPAGFAHGFCALQDNTELLYKMSDFYSPELERGIVWNDPDIAIQWPKLDTEHILCDRDKNFPTLKQAVV